MKRSLRFSAKNEVQRLALEHLQSMLAMRGQAFRLEDGELQVGDLRLAITASPGAVREERCEFFLPLDVQIHLNGDWGDRFVVSALGSGASRGEALRDAIRQWSALAASPLLDALCAAKTDSAGGQWRTHCGAAGLRGAMFVAREDARRFGESLQSRVRSFVETWPTTTSEIRGVLVMGSQVGGAIDIQSAVDGHLAKSLAEELRDLPWPTGPESYHFRQLFVARSMN